MDRYMASVRDDSVPELRDFAASLTIGERPVLDVIREHGDGALAAIEKVSESLYWDHIQKHQEALFELQSRYTETLLPAEGLDPEGMWDFIGRHGWRRFRFSGTALRLLMSFGDEAWVISIVPNYRSRFVEQVKSRSGSGERRAVLDAIEMENLLAHGEPKTTRLVLEEKAADYAGCRHILWGNPASPQFLKLRLKNTNSTMHVSDWVLPLRS